MRISKHISVCYHTVDPAVVAASVAAGYVAFWQMKYIRKGLELCGQAIIEHFTGSKDDKQ